MAVEFKASMTKAELLKIAAENGVTADDSMTKTAILDALEAHNAAEAAGAGTEPPADGTGGNGPEAAADGAESAQDGAENAGAGEDTGQGKDHPCGNRTVLRKLAEPRGKGQLLSPYPGNGPDFQNPIPRKRMAEREAKSENRRRKLFLRLPRKPRRSAQHAFGGRKTDKE